MGLGGAEQMKAVMDLDDAFEALMREAAPHVGAYTVQYRESRRMFYAGAAAVFFHALELTNLPEDQAEEHLSGLQKQIEEFFKERVAKDKD